MKIVFQNAHWVAIDKEAGMLSVPSRTGIEDARRVAGIELQRSLAKQIYPVHRLDAEVSGLLLFALTPRAQRQGNGWFERHEALKTYEALTPLAEPRVDSQTLASWTARARQAYSHFAGAPTAAELENYRPQVGNVEPEIWTSLIERGKRRSFFAAHGKEARTYARCLAQIDGIADINTRGPLLLWELRPLTGRSHQLRVELAVRGYPILGDGLYGSTSVYRESAIALRAVRLELNRTNESDRLGLPAILEVSGLSSK